MTVDSKRTSGEWFVQHNSRGYAVETDRVRITQLGDWDECDKADAYLMAAAPKMLEALQRQVANVDLVLTADGENSIAFIDFVGDGEVEAMA